MKKQNNTLSGRLGSLSSTENKNCMSRPKYSLLTCVQIQVRKWCTSGHFQQNHLTISTWKTVCLSFCFFRHQPFFSIFIPIVACTQKHKCLGKIHCFIWNVHNQVSYNQVFQKIDSGSCVVRLELKKKKENSGFVFPSFTAAGIFIFFFFFF